MSRHESALARLSDRPTLWFTLGVAADGTEPVILDCAGAVTPRLGYDPDDLLGRRLETLFIDDADRAVADGGRVRLQTADGETVPAVGAADHSGDQLRVVFVPESQQGAAVGAPATTAASGAAHSVPWYRDQVYRAFDGADVDTEKAIRRALELCAECLGMQTGFTTRIVDGTQSITRTSGSDDRLRPGMSCPLDEVYCRRTVEREGLLCAQEAAASDEIDDVAFERFRLGSYIRGRLLVDGELHGTVCFADPEPRDRGSRGTSSYWSRRSEPTSAGPSSASAPPASGESRASGLRRRRQVVADNRQHALEPVTDVRRDSLQRVVVSHSQ